MNEPVLQIKDLHTSFFLTSGEVKAVDGVSFDLHKQEILGIIGESGCGKSVTAKSIIRLLPQKMGRIVSGSVIYQGEDLAVMEESRLRQLRGNGISMIFQDPMTSLDPVFKIGDQMVEMICSHSKLSRREALNRSIETLRAVGIPRPEVRVNSYPYELSGGMCQRVIIAMALCQSPDIIIADEPTTALDVTIQAQVLKLLQKLRDENGTSILMITHNLGIIWEMCDNVVVMYAGKIVEKTSTEELYRNPWHPYTWGLLDSMPSLAVKPKQILNTIEGTPPDLRLTGTCCNFCNRCPYALPVCGKEVPPLVEVETGHWVACHRQTEGHTLKREDRENG